MGTKGIMKNEQLVDTIKITLILSEAVIILNDSFTVWPLSVITVEGDDIIDMESSGPFLRG